MPVIRSFRCQYCGGITELVGERAYCADGCYCNHMDNVDLTQTDNHVFISILATRLRNLRREKKAADITNIGTSIDTLIYNLESKQVYIEDLDAGNVDRLKTLLNTEIKDD